MSVMTYGDISPRTAAYVVKKMLDRSIPNLVLEKFGQTYVLPTNSTKTATFRRYNSLAPALTPLVEGVTPVGSKLVPTDYTANLVQYGDYIPMSDVILDTHEDPVLMQAVGVLGEQAALTVETVRFNVLKAGTNVYYANKVANRAAVTAAPTLADQRRITRGFQRQNARQITQIVSSTPAFNTESTEPGYVALIHPDLGSDIRAMTGFINMKDYGSSMKAYEGEIGSVDDVRYIRSTVFTSWLAAGAVVGATGLVAADATNIDVYPILYLAADAYGIVPLKGENALTPIIVNPKGTSSDPLGQRGSAGWKTMQTAVILNELWMARLECGATDI